MVLVYAVPTHAVKNTSWMSRFFKDIRHVDKSSFSLTAGLRAAAFVIAPIILAFVIQQPALFLAAIGAIVLTATAKMLPTITNSSCSLLRRRSELWTWNSYRYYRPSLLSYLTWNCCICSSCSLVQYKVGGCWYVYCNHFHYWSRFTGFFTTISSSEDFYFNDDNWNHSRCIDSNSDNP
jgi:hypothetical protein